MRPRRRNTQAYTFMAWVSFVLALGIFFISLYNADWPLMEKGLYAALVLWLVSATFTLQKVIRDNAEDEHDYPQLREEREARMVPRSRDLD